MWPFTSRTAEREYVSLMYDATARYASWDPLRPVQVGDYGRLQKDGSFASRGNIFEEGLAREYKIEKRTHGRDECRFIVSNNGNELSIAPDINVSLQSIIEGHINYKVAFSKGRGAALAMLRPQLTSITYPGRLSRLLSSSRDWHDFVLVSEVYACRSYARLLTSKRTREVSLGLGASVPIAAAVGVPVNVGGDVNVQWKTDASSGDWKWAHWERVRNGGEDGGGVDVSTGAEGDEPEGSLCYPLFKLVALRRPGGDPVSSLRSLDYELPDVVPPWLAEEHEVVNDGDAVVIVPKEAAKTPWRHSLASMVSSARMIAVR